MKQRLAQLRQLLYQNLPLLYAGCAAILMLGYVRYDPYQIDGDAVSYMDIASAMLHGRWHDIVNGLWNPGYPALLALGKLITHADRLHELQVFYWVNYFIFLFSLACTAFFVRSLLHARNQSRVEPSTAGGWALSDPLLYVAAYSLVTFSWQQEFSFGKIRVDGLFACLLLLAFGCLLRVAFSDSRAFAAGMGLFLGLAYWVKTPGMVFAVLSFAVLAIFLYRNPPAQHSTRSWLLAVLIFVIVVAPYITALSFQKGRFDFGDSAKLNYAWYVSDTSPMHLLPGQSWRFGHSTVNLKHSEVALLADPSVEYFPHFPHTTYGPWFDPSYTNDGVHPHFVMAVQLRILRQESRHVFTFAVLHSFFFVLVCFAFLSGMHVIPDIPLRRVLLLLCGIFLFAGAMYTSIHFLDRYIAGQYWIAWIATMGLLVAPSATPNAPADGLLLTEGAALFLAIAVLLLGAQSTVHLRQTAILTGTYSGWYNAEEFQTSQALEKNGSPPGSNVACFRACDSGAYWARLADVHVTAEIYDPRYMPDNASPNQIWDRLPNKPAMLQALRDAGEKGLVGRFDDPPSPTENWQRLAGHYYWLPLTALPPQ